MSNLLARLTSWNQSLRVAGINTGSAVLDHVKSHTPRLMRRGIRRAVDLFRQPELAYLELHLTDHCNLNCRGCSHYCPLAPRQYADLSRYQSDMHRIRQLFRNIHTIRLMGGEPLLHPDPASFVIATRAVFPQARIRFVTNGILLPQGPPGVLGCLSKHPDDHRPDGISAPAGPCSGSAFPVRGPGRRSVRHRQRDLLCVS